MTIKETIKTDLKTAIIQKDSLTKSVLRGVLTDITNVEKSGRSEKDLKDAEVITVISKGIKSRKETVEIYENVGRVDSAEKEKKEITILEKYLPTQLTQNEVKNIVSDAITQVKAEKGNLNIGSIMKIVKPKTIGKVDNKALVELIKNSIK